MRKLLLIIFSVFFLCSCAQNYYPAMKLADSRNIYTPPLVYVQNTDHELEQELEILKESRLYKISSDPNSPIKIKLKKMVRGGMCGMGILLTGATLGLIPHQVPTIIEYKFDEISETGLIQHEYILKGYYSTSLWESFKEKKE